MIQGDEPLKRLICASNSEDGYKRTTDGTNVGDWLGTAVGVMDGAMVGHLNEGRGVERSALVNHSAF
jgi:hypothetical protein